MPKLSRINLPKQSQPIFDALGIAGVEIGHIRNGFECSQLQHGVFVVLSYRFKKHLSFSVLSDAVTSGLVLILEPY